MHGSTALAAALDLVRWYAREHVVICLLPAFFIAGVISIFVSQGSVLKYFGANAKKWLAYTVASLSGSILAVCSCTVLPLFSSIHKRGAGLGPAIAFLYSGPAINILAIILTARILGAEMGIARTLGAVLFSIVIGLAMSLIYRKEEKLKKEQQMNIAPVPEKRPVGQTAFLFFTLVVILVFANWGAPAGIIPNEWITKLVGGNSVFSNFFASIVGAFMYFATLTEVPILQGLIVSGMGKGPALALLLAGPSLSLPNMLVLRGVMGGQKTFVYVSLVVIMATICGLLYGSM